MRTSFLYEKSLPFCCIMNVQCCSDLCGFYYMWSYHSGWRGVIHGEEWISMSHKHERRLEGARGYYSTFKKTLKKCSTNFSFFHLSVIKLLFVKICDIIWSSFLMSSKVSISKDEALPSWKSRRGDKFTLTVKLFWFFFFFRIFTVSLIAILSILDYRVSARADSSCSITRIRNKKNVPSEIWFILKATSVNFHL